MGRRAATMGVTAVMAVGALAGPARGADPSPRELAADIQQLIEPARRLQIRVDVSVSASAPRRGDRAGVNIELAMRPDLWYSVGVSNGATGTVTETVGAGGEVSRTVRMSDRSLAISARIFKRIGPLVASAGVFDSRAAIGLELRGWQDRVRLEALVVDGRPWEYRDPPSLRAGGSAQWRWFYLQAGIQDLASRELRAAYLGAGMRWTDPDLGYLLPWLTRG